MFFYTRQKSVSNKNTRMKLYFYFYFTPLWDYSNDTKITYNLRFKINGKISLYINLSSWKSIQHGRRGSVALIQVRVVRVKNKNGPWSILSILNFYFKWGIRYKFYLQVLDLNCLYCRLCSSYRMRNVCDKYERRRCAWIFQITYPSNSISVRQRILFKSSTLTLISNEFQRATLSQVGVSS